MDKLKEFSQKYSFDISQMSRSDAKTGIAEAEGDRQLMEKFANEFGISVSELQADIDLLKKHFYL